MALDTIDHTPPRLPRLDQDIALGVNAALAALDGLVLNGLTLSANTHTPADADAVAEHVEFATPHGPVQIAPTLADGAIFVSQDHAALLSVVSMLEPLFVALEDAGCGSLRPEGVTQSDLAGAVRIDVGLSNAEGRVLHAARLSLAPAVARRLSRAGEAAPALDVPLVVGLFAEGPALSQAQIQALRPGDLVLVPTNAGDWGMRLRTAGAAASARGLFSLKTRQFTHQTKVSSMIDQAVPDGAPPVAPALELVPTSDAPVAVTLGLGDVAVSLQALTRLVPGAVLPLPDLPADLTVTLSSAGRAFARGRLVSLGEAHAVLIEAVADTAETH